MTLIALAELTILTIGIGGAILAAYRSLFRH